MHLKIGFDGDATWESTPSFFGSIAPQYLKQTLHIVYQNTGPLLDSFLFGSVSFCGHDPQTYAHASQSTAPVSRATPVSEQSLYEPGSKLLIRRLYRDYVGSCLKGYLVVHKGS